MELLGERQKEPQVLDRNLQSQVPGCGEPGRALGRFRTLSLSLDHNKTPQVCCPISGLIEKTYQKTGQIKFKKSPHPAQITRVNTGSGATPRTRRMPDFGQENAPPANVPGGQYREDLHVFAAL
jgi:hypothetical protein